MIALRNVLVATDFSETSETALTYGRALARAFGARLHLLHVVEDLRAAAYADAAIALSPPGEWQDDIERAGRERLEALVTAEDRQDLRPTTLLITSNSPAKAIVEHAREASMDIIVMGATGRGRVNRMLTGSVADKVIRQAPCPVLTVHHPEREFVTPETGLATTTTK
jgi:nucleotide-binding universal stress UspA family protein